MSDSKNPLSLYMVKRDNIFREVIRHIVFGKYDDRFVIKEPQY